MNKAAVFQRSAYTLDKNLRENVMHPETIQIQGGKKKSFDREHFEKVQSAFGFGRR